MNEVLEYLKDCGTFLHRHMRGKPTPGAALRRRVRI